MIARRPNRHARGWLRASGAILIACLAAGCAAAGEPSTSGSCGPSRAASPAAATAAQRLAAALAPLEAASMFQTKVTVDGVVAVTSSGRSLGEATQLTVTNSGESADYVQIPPNAWARRSGGAWAVVAVGEAPTSPLAVLAAPTTLVVDPSNPAGLVATYQAVKLGLTGGPVTVTITLGAAVTFHYEAATGGHKTVSETTVRPSTNLAPIKAPI